EHSDISRNGSHQLALRRRSAKVLLGAIKVLIILCPWESGGAASGTGVTAIEVMQAPWKLDAADCRPWVISRQARVLILQFRVWRGGGFAYRHAVAVR